MIPPGLMESSPRVVEVLLEASETRPVTFELKQIGDRTLGLEPDPAKRDENRIRRGLGWYSRPIPIDVPAVGNCASYHFECEVPEEMAASFATLSTSRSHVKLRDTGRDGGEGGDTARVRQNLDRGPVQRVHLHLDGVPQGERGVVAIQLRSLPATILRPALMSSTATTLLLLVVAARFPHLLTNVGSVAAALLFVPGLLTAYVVRPREHPMSTSLLFGHRMMAVTSSVCALAAAMLLLVERTWAQKSDGRVILRPSWGYTPELLWVFCGVSALSVVLIFVALRFTSRPPESKQRARPPSPLGSSPEDVERSARTTMG